MGKPVAYGSLARRYAEILSRHTERPVLITATTADWQLLHHSAALKGTTAADLVRELLDPGLKKLRKNPPVRDDDGD